MYDSFNRKVDYLRVSVTDRCNMRCVYCMPETGVQLMRHEDILRFEEIEAVVREAAWLGVTKVRLTGGEPLVRRGVAELVAILARIEGIEDLALSTNGALLRQFAGDLAAAGLHRVNVSLDTLDPVRFAAITRGGVLDEVLDGIEAARAAGLTPIKLNCVVETSADEPDARTVAEYAARTGAEARFIRRMDLSRGDFSRVMGGHGGDCARCNRLRLTADGQVRPCLFTGLAFSVRELGAREALLRAVAGKPATGEGWEGAFYAIGG